MHAGAAEATGADIDAFAVAAIDAQRARQRPSRDRRCVRDVLDEEPPDADVILAGDCWYDAAPRAHASCRGCSRAGDSGIDVIVGDPGRRYLPTGDRSSSSPRTTVRTTTELEDLDHKQGCVYRVRR